MTRLTTAERVMVWMAGVCFLAWGVEYAAALIFGG